MHVYEQNTNVQLRNCAVSEIKDRMN